MQDAVDCVRDCGVIVGSEAIVGGKLFGYRLHSTLMKVVLELG
jgi:hypothetical protein